MSYEKICAVRATQNIAVFFRDGSGCMFRHHVAGLPCACLQAPDTSGCARAWIYFAQRLALFQGKRYKEQYVITYVTNDILLYVVTPLYYSQHNTAPANGEHAQPRLHVRVAFAQKYIRSANAQGGQTNPLRYASNELVPSISHHLSILT
jgi:hypothetical protein